MKSCNEKSHTGFKSTIPHNIEAQYVGWVFNALIKTSFGTPLSHVGMPGLQSWPQSWFQLPANRHPRRKQVVTRVFESLPSIWKNQLQFPAPKFSLAQSCPLWTFGEWIIEWETVLSYSLFLLQVSKINCHMFLSASMCHYLAVSCLLTQLNNRAQNKKQKPPRGPGGTSETSSQSRALW